MSCIKRSISKQSVVSHQLTYLRLHARQKKSASERMSERSYTSITGLLNSDASRRKVLLGIRDEGQLGGLRHTHGRRMEDWCQFWCRR